MLSSPSAAWHAPRRRAQRGFTLLEAVLAIVVLGVGLGGVLLAFQSIAKSSADPVITRQMMAIANTILEEILLKPYAPAANAAPSGCARDTFNDIGDFNGYTSTGICTVDGSAVAALASYSVSVSVEAATSAVGGVQVKNGGGVSAARRITVTVSHSGQSLSLIGWRVDYAS